eukprot:5750387-Pleurochrysis_carterae.AAC.1
MPCGVVRLFTSDEAQHRSLLRSQEGITALDALGDSTLVSASEDRSVRLWKVGRPHSHPRPLARSLLARTRLNTFTPSHTRSHSITLAHACLHIDSHCLALLHSRVLYGGASAGG